MATIATLALNIQANTATLEKSMAQTEGFMKRIEGGAATMGKALAGAFAVGTIVAAGKHVLDFAGEISDLSAKTQISTTGLQKFALAFEQSGIGIETVAKAANELSGRLIGDKGAVALIEKLGFNADSLRRMKPEDRFIAVADAIGKIADQGEKVYASKTLLGKGGVEMLSALTGNLKETTDAFESMGLIIDEHTIAAADEFGDQLGLMGKQLLGIVASILGPLLPALSGLASGLMQVAKVVGDVTGFFVDWIQKGLVAAYSAITSFLATIAEAATRIPLLGKHLGFAADAAEALRAQSEKADKYLVKLFTTTDNVTTSATAARPAMLGLGEDTEKAARAAEKAASAYAKLMSDTRNAEGLAQQAAALAVWSAATSEATKNLQALAMTMQVTLTNQSGLTEALMLGTQAIQSQNASIGGTVDQMIAAQTRAMEWRSAMDQLAESFLTFSQIAGDSMGMVFRQIGSAIAGIRLASDGVGALKAGFAALGSGSVLKGLTGIVGGIGGIASAAQAAIQVVTGLWHGLQRLFGGGEEGTVVNPARDAFFQQFVDKYGMSPFESMAQAFTDAGVSGETAESLIRTLYGAETMDQFRPAAQSIIDAVGQLGFGMNFHSGGMVPGTGEVPATLLGGERVLSRGEVTDLGRIAAELREQRRDLPRQIGDAVVGALVSHGRFRTA